ncbi:uncharacterized protein [Amphiura filiformis]|uniref:uncharacterized protein isoform X2 n=1 Tax=Amphiura filiformis TaxID=82378 RepID=UPI003B21F9BA
MKKCWPLDTPYIALAVMVIITLCLLCCRMLECLQMLISCGVNGEVATQRFHQSPAHVAAFGSQPHCLMWLVQNGANVNAQDYLGETPSHKAARSGSLECLGILKANGAQFTIKNNNGHLPKDLAISCGNETSARYIMQVEQSSGLNGHNVHTNGLCSRKRGITEINGEEIKKIRADPSMPLAQPLPVETVEQSMVPDNLCSDQVTNGLTNHVAPNGLHAENGASATKGCRCCATAMNGSGDASSQLSSHHQQQKQKEYVRVYDYLTNWSAYSGACENNKTLVTCEMESQDSEMTDVEEGALSKCQVSSSAVEHSESVVQAQGYDSKLCESQFEPCYGHAY